MVSFSMASLALKWSYFFGSSAIIVFLEYGNLYMKQLGFSPAQIGLSTLMGIQHLLLPLYGFLGDRFRARKLVLIVSIAVIFLISLAHLLPLVVSFPTCFVQPSESFHYNDLDIHRNVSVNKSSNPFLFSASNKESNSRFALKMPVGKMSNPVEQMKRNNYVPWLSTLFVFLATTKAMFRVTNRGILSLQNVATMTHLNEDRASYGSYYMWGHIGASLSLFAVGLLASHIKLSVCGFVGDGYHITFVWTSVGMMLCSFAIPWFEYEYHKHRVINWSEVKTILFDFHYIIVLFVAFFIGSCTGFQFNWEFWYISELSGSPTIMGVAGLIRRPFLAFCFYVSGFLIGKVGDLKIIASSLFLFSISFLAISFVNVPWLVLAIDLLQAAAYGFSYSGLTVHFSKAGSKASSAVIFGLSEMVYSMGVDAGSGVMGILFHAFGAKTTLFYYSFATASILVGFLAYIYFYREREDYETPPLQDDDKEDDY